MSVTVIYRGTSGRLDFGGGKVLERDGPATELTDDEYRRVAADPTVQLEVVKRKKEARQLEAEAQERAQRAAERQEAEAARQREIEAEAEQQARVAAEQEEKAREG